MDPRSNITAKMTYLIRTEGQGDTYSFYLKDGDLSPSPELYDLVEKSTIEHVVISSKIDGENTIIGNFEKEWKLGKRKDLTYKLIMRKKGSNSIWWVVNSTRQIKTKISGKIHYKDKKPEGWPTVEYILKTDNSEWELGFHGGEDIEFTKCGFVFEKKGREMFTGITPIKNRAVLGDTINNFIMYLPMDVESAHLVRKGKKDMELPISVIKELYPNCTFERLIFNGSYQNRFNKHVPYIVPHGEFVLTHNINPPTLNTIITFIKEIYAEAYNLTVLDKYGRSEGVVVELITDGGISTYFKIHQAQLKLYSEHIKVPFEEYDGRRKGWALEFTNI